jgi:DNA invertase Pin-like site-specific DNA recombinase
VLADHEAEAMIVYSSDRLTRKLAHKLIIREELQRAGIELHYVRRGKSEDTAEQDDRKHRGRIR